MPDISVIVVNWNSKEFVGKCLESLFRHAGEPSFQIVVVDNASYDGCREMVADRFPHVTFVQLEKNVGFGRANNEGFRFATSKVVWLLNPDTEVRADAPKVLYNELTASPKIGLVGARLLNSDGSLQTTCVQPLPTALNQAFDSEALRTRFGIWGMNALRSENKPVAVEAVSGACMMMRSSDFRAIGGFDPRYFMYCEDMDLCFSLRKRGLEILYVPTAQVVHHGGRSSDKQVSKFSVVMTREALIAYFLKNSGPFRASLYRLLIGLSAALRIAVLSFIELFGSPRSGKLSGSRRKWEIILSWCFGRERWTQEYSHQ